LKSSEGNVDPIAVLEPNFTFPTPTDNPAPKVKNPLRWLLGAQQVGTEANIPNESEVWECVLCEEGTDLFDQREKGRVHIAMVVGEFGVKKAGINIANGNEFKGRMGREEDVRGDPVGRFPMPLGIRGTNKFSKVGTPIGERDGRHVTGVS